MISKDGNWMLCDEEDCPRRIPNHKWGRIRDGVMWFFSRDGKNMRCPDHDPRDAIRKRNTEKTATTAILVASIDERLEMLEEKLNNLGKEMKSGGDVNDAGGDNAEPETR